MVYFLVFSRLDFSFNWEVCHEKKNTARQTIFSSLLHVWKCSQTWPLYFQKIAVSFDFQLFISDLLPEMMIPATFWLQVAPIIELTKKDEIVVYQKRRAKTIKVWLDVHFHWKNATKQLSWCFKEPSVLAQSFHLLSKWIELVT